MTPYHDLRVVAPLKPANRSTCTPDQLLSYHDLRVVAPLKLSDHSYMVQTISFLP